MRDEIVDKIEEYSDISNCSRENMLRIIGLPRSKYYDWRKRYGKKNHHNGFMPCVHWTLPEEKEAVLEYFKTREYEGYRRMAYRMIDEDIACLSPSTVYRILKKAGLLIRWNQGESKKGTGFKGPDRPHQHWHIDIAHINILGTIYYLISILDGYSRYLLHFDLRASMTEFDVELILNECHEKYPDAKPRVISDNGKQFIAKDFKEFIRKAEFSHVRTSVYYPQSNGKLERFHGTIKSEAIRRQSYTDISDAKRQIKDYIYRYNHERLHSALFYLTPNDFLKGSVKEKLDIREKKLEKAKLNRMKKWQRKAA